MNAKVSGIIRDIKSLKIQGAREVAKAGLECLVISAKGSKAANSRDFMKELKGVVRELVKTRPTEPMLRNVVASVMLKLSDYDGDNFRKVTASLCNDQMMKIEQALINIAKIGAARIAGGETILTHCHSHDVVAILIEARRQGKRFDVIVTETEPRRQGEITARELLKAGIGVTYCVDSAIGYVMKDADRVLVGCDAILADGSIVNKIGTFPIAIVAERFGVPVYVAGETLKFDTQTMAGIPETIEQRDPREVIDPMKIKGAKIINPAFDITPSNYVHSLITEKGIMKPELLRREMSL